MFWGLIMEPQRRYTQKVQKAFHISMAAMDISTSSDGPSQVMLGFEGRTYLLCTLRKPDLVQQELDLNFEVGDEISFAANGNCYVHLTGYLIEDPNEFMGEEEEEEEDEEVMENQKTKKKNKKRNNNAIENGPPVKKSKKKEIEEKDEDSSDTDEVDVKALLENTIESDDDDDTFAEDVEEEEDDVEDEEDDDEDGEEESEEEVVDEEEDDDEEEASSSESETEEESKKNVTPKLNGVAKKNDVSTPKQKKDKNNEQKKQQVNKDKSPSKEEQSPKDKKKKVLQNGLIIEDLKEGQGKPANPGKFITVYYEGRLKSNNKVFDATKKGAGFSFRLGGGEVIKGWDNGLVGMKVGGKRRITCPPNMAYGAKGSPPAIPANSTLVFEVELKKIR